MSKLLIVLAIVLLQNNVFAKDLKYSTETRLCPLLLSHRTYAPVEPIQPVRHLIEIAHNTWHFDGVELSMDGLILEGSDDLSRFRFFIECLKDDLKLLTQGNQVGNDWTDFQLRLRCDFDIFDWVDDEIKATMVAYVLENLPIRSYTLCFSDNPTSGQILDTLVIYNRHGCLATNRHIEVPGGLNTKTNYENLNKVYSGPITISTDKTCYRSDNAVYERAKTDNNPSWVIHDTDTWFQDKSVYRITDAVKDMKNPIGLRVVYTVGNKSTHKVQAYERFVYKELFKQMNYIPEYVVLAGNVPLKYDLHITDVVKYTPGRRLTDKVETRLESHVGRAGMGSASLRDGYLNLVEIMVDKHRYFSKLDKILNNGDPTPIKGK